MPLKFDVDGKVMENPSPADISSGFGSIDTEGIRAISIIQLDRNSISLYAFGHPKEGYTLEIDEARFRKVTSPEKPLPQSEVIRIFQAFSRSDDAWQSRFDWEQLDKTIPTSIIGKRLILYFALFALLLLLLKYVQKTI